jgi:hypothetical protein
MVSIISIVIYMIGVYLSFSKILEWNEDNITKKEDYQTLFAFSMFSWLAFLFYGITTLLNEQKEL